jgi:hypothetical protein
LDILQISNKLNMQGPELSYHPVQEGICTITK